MDQAAELARMLRMHVVYRANLDRDPVNPGEPRRQYGTAILSDAPIHNWRNTLLPRTGKIEAITESLVDAWTEAGVGDGYTLSAENPYARIDYVLHSADVVARSATVLSTVGSDHLPVTADLVLPGDRVGAGGAVRAAR